MPVEKPVRKITVIEKKIEANRRNARKVTGTGNGQRPRHILAKRPQVRPHAFRGPPNFGQAHRAILWMLHSVQQKRAPSRATSWFFPTASAAAVRPSKTASTRRNSPIPKSETMAGSRRGCLAAPHDGPSTSGRSGMRPQKRASPADVRPGEGHSLTDPIPPMITEPTCTRKMALFFANLPQFRVS